MVVLYRISNNSNIRERLCSKEESLSNFISVFKCRIIVIADNCNDDLIQYIKSLNLELIEINVKSNGKSFIYCLNLALKFDLDEVILFQEDDYLYHVQSEKIIGEGIQIADYVTLYDHPDKYHNLANPLINDSGEQTKVFLTNSCHWKKTNSTTMTFAAKVKTLIQDEHIIRSNIQYDLCLDYKMFLELLETKTLISPIPSYSTHTEMTVLSPLRNYANNVYS